MKKQHTNYLFYLRNAKAVFAFIALLCGISNTIWSQTTVYSNDFNVAENPLGTGNPGSPAMTWTAVTTTGTVVRTNSGITGTPLIIQNGSTAGRSYLHGELANFYEPFQSTLNSNLSDITWTFNIRTNRGSTSLGFDASTNRYGYAVILCSTSSDFLASNGYAVTLMQGTAKNAIRLVKFTGGIVVQSNLNTIIGPSADAASETNYFSVKVIYSPLTNKWKLYARNDGTLNVDPTLGNLTQIGTETFENTFTTSSMSHFGFFMNHQNTTTAENDAYFDNFKVTLNNAPTVNANSSLSGLGLTELQLANSDFRISGSEFVVNQNATVNSVLVSPNAKLTVNDGVSLNATNGIILQNTADGTASFVDSRVADNPTAIAGTVEQAITETNRNWYVAVPVSGKLASDITLSGAKIVQRNEALSRWDDVLSGTTITPGVGYIAVASAMSGTTSWSLNGNLNSGKVEVGVTRSGANSTGFNLLGNPYPSYLNWEQVLNLNATNASLLQSSIWYRTKSGASYAFQTYNSAGRVATPTSTTGYIPPMQAFWVRANAAGTVTFTNAMRSHGDGASNKLKAPKVNTQQIIRLQVSNAVVTDEAVVYIDQNAQNVFDKYDTEKMFNNVASQPELYTKAGTEKLVINGLNEVHDNQELPIGITYAQGGDLKLKVTEMSDFDYNTRVYLRDKQENIETELTPQTEYAFSTLATTDIESRFSLVFRAPGVTTGTTNTTREQISVFVNTQNEIVILTKENINYNIFNVTGQLMSNGKTGNQPVKMNVANKGVYIVTVNGQSNRIIIQ